MELSVVPTQCGVRVVSAKIVPIFAQIWRVSGLQVSSNTWRQKFGQICAPISITSPFSFYCTLWGRSWSFGK